MSRNLYMQGGLEVLGKHFVIPRDLDSRWRNQAACSSLVRSDTKMARAWQLGKDSGTYDGVRIHGSETYRLALTYCEMCPVQWDCATYGVAAEERGSLYAMTAEDLRWLIKSKRGIEIIQAARENNVSMQRAVSLARQHHVKVSSCPTSVPVPSPTRTKRSPASSTTSSSARSTGGANRPARKSRSPRMTPEGSDRSRSTSSTARRSKSPSPT